MMNLLEKIEQTSEFLRSKIKTAPSVGIILGSGLGGLADDIDVSAIVPYEDIPHFPLSTVEFHAGKLHFGRLAGKMVMAMQGRFHYYEGYSMQEITFPVRVMKAMGVKALLISNACGCVNPLYHPGDLMIIDDHINLLGDNPLIGPNHDELGARFPDMSEPYSQRLIKIAEQVALDNKLLVQKGIFAAVTGPNLETRAEYRMLRLMGADVVGMSTVPEVIIARHADMEVFGMSVITDEGFADCLKPANIPEILRTAREAEPKLTEIMKGVIERM
ncbi:purine-nucleoside phosphorylase, partial [bacterium]|nr:purine-nucleoside phosphorylase [bacterium]